MRVTAWTVRASSRRVSNVQSLDFGVTAIAADFGPGKPGFNLGVCSTAFEFEKNLLIFSCHKMILSLFNVTDAHVKELQYPRVEFVIYRIAQKIELI